MPISQTEGVTYNKLHVMKSAAVRPFFRNNFAHFYPISAMLGTRYEFLTMHKVISGPKRYRTTNNLEKSDFFEEKLIFRHFSGF